MIEVEDFLEDLTKIKLVVDRDASTCMGGKEFLKVMDSHGVKDISNLDRNNFDDWFLFFEIQLQWHIFIEK